MPRALPGPVQWRHHQKREGRRRPQLRRYTCGIDVAATLGIVGGSPDREAGRAGDSDAGAGYQTTQALVKEGFCLQAGGGRGATCLS